jgi:hypothetical protein
VSDQPVIFNLDLDEELLSHLPDPDAWVVLQGEEFAVELIEDEFVAEVYTWQRKHMRENQGKPATAAVLADEFDIDFRAPETAVGDLLDRIRERYMKNQGRQGLVEIAKLQKADPLAVPQELIRRGRELSNLLSKRGEVFGTGDHDRAMRRYDLKAERGPGASFGHPTLDEFYYGMVGLNFLIAYKKSFKSWQMVQCLAANALAGRCAYLYSLELPAEETDMRLRCLLSGVPWWKYTRNALGPQDRAAIKEASDLIDGMGIFRIIKPRDGHRGIHELVHTARDGGADIVLIDQLQYVENDKGKSLGRLNDTGEYWGVLNDARTLSDEGPIYIAHQFGRAAMGAESMPDIALAKGSSSIEEVCTLALGMWANKDMRRSGIVEIGTLIARNAVSWGSWEMEVDLTRDCRFTIVGRTDDE